MTSTKQHGVPVTQNSPNIENAPEEEKTALKAFQQHFHPYTYPTAVSAAQKAGITLLIINWAD